MSGSLTINVNDDTPTAPESVTASTVLDDDAQTLFPGNAGGAGDVPNATLVSVAAAGTLFSTGADGLQSVAITTFPTFSAIYESNGLALQETVTWGAASVDPVTGDTTWTATGAVSGDTVATLTIEADERVGSKGDVVTNLDEAKLRDELRALGEKNIEALTVSLINAFAKSHSSRSQPKAQAASRHSLAS